MFFLGKKKIFFLKLIVIGIKVNVEIRGKGGISCCFLNYSQTIVNANIKNKREFILGVHTL